MHPINEGSIPSISTKEAPVLRNRLLPHEETCGSTAGLPNALEAYIVTRHVGIVENRLQVPARAPRLEGAQVSYCAGRQTTSQEAVRLLFQARSMRVMPNGKAPRFQRDQSRFDSCHPLRRILHGETSSRLASDRKIRDSPVFDGPNALRVYIL